MRNKLRRPLAFLLSVVMIVTMSGTPVHAVSDRGQPETGLCEHHTAHTEDCGYTEETPGAPCDYEHKVNGGEADREGGLGHTEDCYIEVTECVHEHTPECYPEEAEDSVSDNEATPANAKEWEPENCPHICDEKSGCVTKKLDCQYEHDRECGYTESTPGTPCTYVCEICNPKDSGEADKEPETGIIKQEQCSCLTLCTEGQTNPDCPVCGGSDAGLSDCKGKAAEEDTEQPEDTGICKHHQEHDNACGYQPGLEDSEGSLCTYECRICPIEALIAALPDDVTSDNADDVWGQLDEILALFSELTEDEQEQIDLSRVYELQGALDSANAPIPLAIGDVTLTTGNKEVIFTVGECGDNCQGHTITQNVQGGVVEAAKILVESGTHDITFSGLNLSSAVVGIMPGGTMNLTLDGNNTITANNNFAGIYVPVDATLVITEESTGSLTVSGSDSAGIGGAWYAPTGKTGNFDCGTVVINGGTIAATGSGVCAGIGGAYDDDNQTGGNGGTVTINGGTVTATGGVSNVFGGAGIGGGGATTSREDSGGGGTLTINGGHVTLTAPCSNAYGFGKGYGRNPSGTCSLTLADESYLTLTDGTNLDPNGTYTINGDPTEDMIVVPELVYTGEILDTSEIRIDDSKTGTATYFGQTFQVKASADGWVLQDLGEVREAKEYTATFKKDDKEISKKFTVAQSGTEFTGDGAVKTYKDGAECSDFTASDTITVKATPTATGQAPTKAAARLRGDPTAGQMAVFVGDTQVSAPADVGEDGTYTMTVSAADVLAAAGGPGTGITLTAKFVGNDSMADGEGTVTVNISAAAKIENGSFTTYVGESGLDAAFADSGNSGATITLLANVTRATTLAIKVNCTLDLNGHNIKSTNETCLSVDGSFAVTIQGEGEIISEQIHALVVRGSVTLEGGTFTSNKETCAGVYVNSEGASLSVNENVTIQNTGGGYGLAVNNAQSQSVQLSAGTYSGAAGAISIVSGSLTLGNLLAHSGDTRYAYFKDTSTTPLTGVLGDKSLTGTVRVQKCEHDKSVCAYTPNEDADTHAMTCRACGLEGAAESCAYSDDYGHDETNHWQTCTLCGGKKTEAHSWGYWASTTSTIHRSCKNCEIGTAVGTASVTPDFSVAYGETGSATLACTAELAEGYCLEPEDREANCWYLTALSGGKSWRLGRELQVQLPDDLPAGEYRYNASPRLSYQGDITVVSNINIFGYVTVTPALLTVTGAAAKDRTYDGTNSVQITGVTLDGVLNSDNVSVDLTGLTGTLSGSDAETYTSVTLPRLTLTGGAASNYTLTQPAGAVPASVTIEKAPALTPKTDDLAVANKQEHTYTYGLGALRPNVQEGMSLGSTAVTYELGTVSLGSYYDSTKDGAKIEGQTLTLPIEAVQNDKAEEIGTVTVIIHTQNFEDMTATIKVRSVNKQSVDISGVTLTGRTYNGSPIEYQQTATASVDGKTVNVNGFVYTWDTPNHAAPVNAGNYTLTVSVDPEDQNYTGSTTIPVVIEQAEIKVTAPSKTIHVGETAPVFSAADCTITGLAQGENLKTLPTVAYAEAPDTSKTGSVTVTASGAEVPEGGNYKDQIVYENGTLTITSKPLPPTKYTITVQAGTGGTASASPTSAEKGTKITLTATPDSGYHFKEWQVISGGVTINDNSFTMPAANVTVKAVFVKNSNGGGNSGGSGNGGGSSSGGSGSSGGDNGSSGGGSTIVARPDENKPDTPTTSQTKPAAPDKNGNVTVDNGTVQSAINTAKNDAKKNGNTANGVAVVIPVTPKEGQNSWGVTMNAQTLDTLVRENVKRLEINIEGVAVGGMDTKLLQWLDTLSANGDVMFRVRRADPSGLSEEAKAAIGTRPVYDLSLVYLSGGKETPITDLGGHTIAVRLPYAPAKEEQAGNLYAVYVDGKGKVEWLTKSSYNPDLGTVVFETGHFSIYGIGYKNPVPAFTDIKNHWAEDNIIFAASRGLLTGTGNNQFSPDTGMTRGMFVTALGRLAGIDPDSYKTGKFTDVKADAYYAPYVNWAAEKGIVNGTTATTFSPDANITREQMAGILAGKGGNRFDPKGNATRAEVATVLRRFVEIVIDPQTAQGWVQDHSGSWQYMKNGKPATGWLQDGEKWYWLDNDGWMFASGWKQIDGKWYYFYPDGSMAVSTTIDGYTIGQDGARK